MSEDTKQKIWLKPKKELLDIKESPELKIDQVVSVPAFTEDDEWFTFLNRLELYFKENNVQPGKKVSLLITSLNNSMYNHLKKLTRPDLPNTKTYKQLTTLLTNHFTPKCGWKQRLIFFKLKQGQENVDEWYVKVCNAASSCDFGTNYFEHVKNKFVSGLKNGLVLDRLCEEDVTASVFELRIIARAKERELNTSCTSNFTSDIPPPFGNFRQSPRLLNRGTKNVYEGEKENVERNFRFQFRSRWDDPNDRRGVKRPFDPDDNSGLVPTCICGIPAKKLAVRREGPNVGREFFVCSKEEDKCSLYTWADEIGVITNCFCGLTAKRKTVRKEGPNQGRQFYSCPRDYGDPSRCNYYVWAEEAEAQGSIGSGSRGGRGSYGNSGTSSHNRGRGRGGSGPSPAKRPKTTSKPSSNFKATGGKEAPKTRKCGVCGQPGHNRKSCPQNK